MLLGIRKMIYFCKKNINIEMKPLIIIAAVALVVVIILIRMYPLLRIWMSRLFFGKHSARYVTTYKRYIRQSPYSYCIKDDFINHLVGCYKLPSELPTFDSDLEIEFSDVQYGQKFKEVIKAFPSPICINAIRLPAFELQVLGYKSQLFSYEMKKYFFFANGRFFMGQTTFNNSTIESRAELINVLQKKYLNGQKTSATDFLIRGKNQSFLRCEYNGFYLILSYLSRADAETIALVDEHWNSSVTSTTVEQSSLHDELMDKL